MFRFYKKNWSNKTINRKKNNFPLQQKTTNNILQPPQRDIMPIINNLDGISNVQELENFVINNILPASLRRLNLKTILYQGILNASIMILSDIPLQINQDNLLYTTMQKYNINLQDCCISSSIFWDLKISQISNKIIFDKCDMVIKKLLSLINIKYIFILGNVALRFFLPNKNISTIRGKFIDYEQYKLFVSFNPNSILNLTKQKKIFIQDCDNFFLTIKAS